METFAKRLKLAIEKRALSQAQAARQCGVTQQSINYIISNDLKSSKLAPQIASSLGINPEWLICGRGKFEETQFYEIPIIHSLYMLKKFLNQELDNNALDYTVVDADLGPGAFAFLLEPKKLLICAKALDPTHHKQYLTIQDSNLLVTDKKKELSFPIFEWRTRDVDF